MFLLGKRIIKSSIEVNQKKMHRFGGIGSLMWNMTLIRIIDFDHEAIYRALEIPAWHVTCEILVARVPLRLLAELQVEVSP
jgi:hypothetical protein